MPPWILWAAPLPRLDDVLALAGEGRMTARCSGAYLGASLRGGWGGDCGDGRVGNAVPRECECSYILLGRGMAKVAPIQP